MSRLDCLIFDSTPRSRWSSDREQAGSPTRTPHTARCNETETESGYLLPQVVAAPECHEPPPSPWSGVSMEVALDRPPKVASRR
ncbi:MAG TPA: hypothetical protein VN156_11065 [Pseudomonas sp.]|nr:hypothetical protein [Pseudomonas sp.]